MVIHLGPSLVRTGRMYIVPLTSAGILILSTLCYVGAQYVTFMLMCLAELGP